MAKRPVITPVSVGNASNALNENFNRIAAAFDNTISRDGSTPNQLLGDLDVNTNSLLNILSVDTKELTVNGKDIIDLIKENGGDTVIIDGGGGGGGDYDLSDLLQAVSDAENARDDAVAASTAAATSATNSASSASGAASSASAAASSASTASTAASNASTSASSAGASATSASGSATSAAASAAAAAQSAIDAEEAAAGSGGGTDLIPLDNTWTGTNLWQNTGKFQQAKANTGPTFQVIRADSPTNYDYSFPISAFQGEQDYGGSNVPNTVVVDTFLFRNTDTSQGTTTSSVLSGVTTSTGVNSYLSKENDGTAHTFTSTLVLGANGSQNGKSGANGYNEGIGYQASVSNGGSNNAYLAGVKFSVSDSNDNGGTSHATGMAGVVSNLKKYNVSSLKSYSFQASSNGTQNLTALMKIGGNASWETGFDFYGTTFSTGVLAKLSRQQAVRWTNGTLNTDVSTNSSGHFTVSVAGTEIIRCSGGSVFMVMGGSSQKQILLGPDNSGGSGYRMMRVVNGV